MIYYDIYFLNQYIIFYKLFFLKKNAYLFKKLKKPTLNIISKNNLFYFLLNFFFCKELNYFIYWFKNVTFLKIIYFFKFFWLSNNSISFYKLNIHTVTKNFSWSVFFFDLFRKNQKKNKKTSKLDYRPKTFIPFKKNKNFNFYRILRLKKKKIIKSLKFKVKSKILRRKFFQLPNPEIKNNQILINSGYVDYKSIDNHSFWKNYLFFFKNSVLKNTFFKKTVTTQNNFVKFIKINLFFIKGFTKSFAIVKRNFIFTTVFLSNFFKKKTYVCFLKKNQKSKQKNVLTSKPLFDGFPSPLIFIFFLKNVFKKSIKKITFLFDFSLEKVELKSSLNYFFLEILFKYYQMAFFYKNTNMFNFFYRTTYLKNLNKPYVYTNFYPICFLPLDGISLLIKKNKFFKKNFQSMFLRHYIGGFFENLFRKKVFFKIKPFIDFPKNVENFLNVMMTEHKMIQKNIGVGFFFDEMVFLLWYSLFEKDPVIFMSWFCRTMTKMPINKHKSILRTFKYLISFYVDYFLNGNSITGLKFDIRGKVGVTGDSKKRHFFFNLGHTSFSRKNHRLTYNQGLVYTNTGVMGVTLIYYF